MPQFVRFSRKKNAEFAKTIKSKVNAYFNENNISKYGNYKMVIKSVIMLSIYFTPYFIILNANFSNYWLYLPFWMVMGIGMAGVGMGIMHDANHGSYSKSKFINRTMSSVIYFVGANALNWRIQHNILHHTYTNIDGLDEDIKAPVGALRFSPHQPKKAIHKYQHIYAWFFYSFLTLFWAIDADFKQIYDFKKKGLTEGHKKNFASVMFELIFFKIFYYIFIFVIPISLSAAPWWILVLGFFTMQFVAGIILTSVFQPAHVVPDTDYPLPDEKGNVEQNWLVHQLHTTANFGQKNKLLTWFVGGLNHQVEHHLFPTICHIHYPKISKIVKETAEEFGLPYHSYPSFTSALQGHVQLLKKFGQ